MTTTGNRAAVLGLVAGSILLLLPGIFQPVKLDGRWLFDGAIVNPIPVSVCRALGASVVIAVNLHHDVFGKGTIVTPEFDRPGDTGSQALPLAALDDVGPQRAGALQLLHRQFFGGRGTNDVPGISTVMLEAFNISQDRIARSRLAGDPPDFTIAPRLNGFGVFDFHRAAELIAVGTAAAERSLDDIRESVATLAA